MKAKSYISKWSNDYHRIFQESRLLSQIPLFIIAVILFCEFLEPFTRGVFPGEEPDWTNILKYSCLSLLMILPLVIRFALLFSKSKNTFFISQVLWLLSITLFFYYFNVRTVLCLRTDEAFMFLYLIISPIRQFVSFVLAFFIKF